MNEWMNFLLNFLPRSKTHDVRNVVNIGDRIDATFRKKLQRIIRPPTNILSYKNELAVTQF